MEEIIDGLLENLDITIYANPKFTREQMYEICEGLRSGIDVSWYADYNIPHTKMANIRATLEEGEIPDDVSEIEYLIDLDRIHDDFMRLISKAKKEGINLI